MANTATKVETFIKNVTTVTAEIDGQLVALDIQAGVCFGLNEVATEIWKLLDSHAELQGISDSLVKIYDIDIATCEIETSSLLSELVAAGLISKS